MANGLDRLERLFSKRKSAPARDTTVSNINGTAPPADPAHPGQDSPLLEVVFPPPSFIRPTTNRMHARDEFELPSPISVAHSSSSNSARNSRRHSHFDTREMTDTAGRRRSGPSTTASFHMPSRASSLLTRRHDRKAGGPIQLQLPGGTTSTDRPPPLSPQSPAEDTTSTSEDQKVAQRRLLEALPIYPGVKVETPPASDQDEFNFPSPPSSTRGRLPPAILSPFTPEPSPDMIPQRDSILSEPKTSSDLRRESVSTAPSRSRRTTLATISSTALLDDDWRDSYVDDPQVTTSPEKSTVFQEPRVQDIFALTADDLAEVRTKAPSNPPLRLPPPPPVLPPGVRYPSFSSHIRGSNMLAPLAPDEVAAFQAARIAKKYDFDFLYIINFWPKEMSHLHRPSDASSHPSLPSCSAISSPTSSFSKPPSVLYSPTSDCPTTKNSTPRHSLQAAPSEAESSSNTSSDPHHIPECCPGAGPPPRPATAGRLLAAYGLSSLDGPFRPGARAHKKILREGTDGWIEYRKTDARENEFARGYARSYYTSTEEISPRRASAPGGSTSTQNPSVIAAAAARLATQTEGALAVRQSFSLAEGVLSADPRARNNSSAAPAGRGSSGPARKVTRGIVFAAYRRPRGHGGTVHSSQAELDALERDAEALVELVLDFHQDRRRWEVYQDARRASD
ncbi:hypothetical protein KVR01_005048 [Diaporthe batatas]|uniref:uncharacterized protein n=1 Tax=Diaporthe batatas TaxID=748121 RepID=UPI001D03F894|nr:uncharacterized protein KVR01_005048 [Diaporthe batatas]KAG8164773.1 hypothetical protein KVR01_005048 [Diaporthe batatas]